VIRAFFVKLHSNFNDFSNYNKTQFNSYDVYASSASSSLKGDIRRAMYVIQQFVQLVCTVIRRRASILSLSIALALLLTGCIKPDAPDPDATLPAIPATAISAATLAPIQPVQQTAAPAGSNPTMAPLPTTAPPVAGGGIVAPDGLWKQQPVGPETVAVMFFHQNGAGCIRYIFRATVVPRCAAGTQTMAVLTGMVQTADKVQWTIIAGRSLDPQITAVSVELADGSSQPADVTTGGFVIALQGVHQPRDVVPINAIGNLVGGKIGF
jgi:hypothetical protein